ncbi:hypothetical protein [Ornithinimicrobium cerasi]|uniref:Uncharacterized protein n=1 Tax=Ornithinimicrobium cerasi TaxID=2248773 RepID=A0A285VMB3_9MICO|nr:hypothetical protein [Ornithinimicrobium cerasi]SOC55220.1 hypothetical protein SAMN05421879_104279 [Ornithinimicrobium cerasi]
MTTSSGATRAPWRSIGSVTIVLFLVGAYLLGSGLVPAVPLVYGGSEEEAAQRDAGLVRLTLGCAVLALLGLVLAVASGLRIGKVIVIVAALTPILGVAAVGWTYVSAAALVALALGGTVWVSKQWWSDRPGR